MDIYELIEEYQTGSQAQQIVAAVMDDLNDRRGIKQALCEVDREVTQEIFEQLTEKVNAIL